MPTIFKCWLCLSMESSIDDFLEISNLLFAYFFPPEIRRNHLVILWFRSIDSIEFSCLLLEADKMPDVRLERCKLPWFDYSC